MCETKYIEQYKDPRWQKIRLQVLERDNWQCQKCSDIKSTLHVHHLYYENGKPIWDYPLSCFVTLCEKCHDWETKEKITCTNEIIGELSSIFLPSELSGIAASILRGKSSLLKELQQNRKKPLAIIKASFQIPHFRKYTNDCLSWMVKICLKEE